MIFIFMKEEQDNSNYKIRIAKISAKIKETLAVFADGQSVYNLSALSQTNLIFCNYKSLHCHHEDLKLLLLMSQPSILFL